MIIEKKHCGKELYNILVGISQGYIVRSRDNIIVVKAGNSYGFSNARIVARPWIEYPDDLLFYLQFEHNGLNMNVPIEIHDNRKFRTLQIGVSRIETPYTVEELVRGLTKAACTTHIYTAVKKQMLLDRRCIGYRYIVYSALDGIGQVVPTTYDVDLSISNETLSKVLEAPSKELMIMTKNGPKSSSEMFNNYIYGRVYKVHMTEQALTIELGVHS